MCLSSQLNGFTMSALRERQILAERCMSPNEHVDLIRELEARYVEMLKPFRDLNKNFAVSLDVLEKYIAEVRRISFDTINFSNAGLVLQSSKEVYARKVDYLGKLFEELQRTAYNAAKTDKDEADTNDLDESAKAKRSKRRKALIDGLDEYKLILPDDIPQLADCGEMNFNNVGLTYITQLRACLLKPEISVHVELKDNKGEPIGRKNDFRVNWPVDQDGMPRDLTMSYYEERIRKQQPPDDICDGLSDHGDDHMSDAGMLTPPRVSPAESMFGNPNSTSTPSVNRNADANETPQRRMRTRTKKLPPKLTLSEFLHGKKRTTRKAKTKTLEKPSKRKRPENGEVQSSEVVPEPVGIGCLIPTGLKEEGNSDLKADGDVTCCRTSPERPPSRRDRHVDETLDVKDDALTMAMQLDGNCLQAAANSNDPTALPERCPSSVGSPADCGMDTAFSDDDLDVPRRGDLHQGRTSTPSGFFQSDLTVAVKGDDQTAEGAVSSGPNNEQEPAVFQLDPMNQRIRAWEDRIVPILDELGTRPKFRLPEYANRILGNIDDGEAVPCREVVTSSSRYEAARKFVALLHLCNTRNVVMQNASVSLLSREYRLSAEDIESYQ